MQKQLLLLFLILTLNVYSQSFPNPAGLSTGQGSIGSLDPIWLVSPWFSSSPPNPIGLAYSPALINNNCAPGAWVNPATLPVPINNGNWITGNDANCANNAADGYRYFRLTLDLPADCNGNNIAINGNYILYLSGYVDNSITDVFVNGTSLGISGGNYSAGSQLNVTLPGPWITGINFVDVQVFNIPNGSANPYGLLFVANSSASAMADTDGDGISDINDLCPCEVGYAVNGCPPPITPNTQICQGESTSIGVSSSGTFLWNTGETTSSILVSPLNTTQYSCIITYSNNIQENLSTTVTVLPSYTATESQIICEGESYLFGNNQYNQSGNYTVINQTVNGCDSISNLQLVVNSIYSDVFFQSICQGETLNFEGINYSIGGLYENILISSQGCDSIRILNLSVLDTSFSIQNITECSSYFWNGQLYSQSGQYTFVTLNQFGCDSMAIIDLVILNPIITNSTIVACESYNWNGQTYTQSGLYSFTAAAANGCDSTANLNLTINPISITQISENACDTYIWPTTGSILNTTGTYSTILANQFGCDSTIVLELTIYESTQTIEEVSSCDTYTWDPTGLAYNQSGNYQFETNTIHGCDSSLQLNLTILNSSSTSETRFTCTYADTLPTFFYFTNQFGCDSVHTIIPIPLPEEMRPQALFTASPTIVELPYGIVTFTNLSSNSNIFNWYFNDGSIISNEQHPEHVFVQEGFYNVMLISSDDLGCTDTAEIQVITFETVNIFVPNSFTPDGNEFNNTFRVQFSNPEKIEQFHLIICNRWGEIVFESFDLFGFWDGTYGSHFVQSGSYNWVLKYKENGDSEKRILTGHLSILK
jgi:gliding motility-associated-like protein